MRFLEVSPADVHSVVRLDEYDAVIRDLLEHYRRVRVYDNLAQWIVTSDGLLNVDGYIHQQLKYGRDPLWMDAILGLFQTQNTLHFGVTLQYGQCKKPQCTIRQGTCRVRSSISVLDIQRHELSFLIEIYVDAVYVVDEFTESVGDLTVYSYVFAKRLTAAIVSVLFRTSGQTI